MNEREAWLNSLAVGDEVAQEGNMRSFRIGKVVRVLKTQIAVKFDNGYEHNYMRATGYAVGRPSFSKDRILPITDEIRESVERGSLADTLSRAEWRKLSLDKLSRIVAIFKEPEASDE